MEDNDKFDEKPKFPQHVIRHFGKAQKNVYVWQCAYADCKDEPWVLKGDIWKRLSNYDRLNRSYIRKEYDSADAALEDMRRASNECNQRSGEQEQKIQVGNSTSQAKDSRT